MLSEKLLKDIKKAIADRHNTPTHIPVDLLMKVVVENAKIRQIFDQRVDKLEAMLMEAINK